MRTYHGSCHCGAIAFEAGFDLAHGTTKCNCSICTKLRLWAVRVQPAHFKLLRGADALREYRFGARRDGHYGCAHCGVHLYSTGGAEATPFYGVNVMALDDLETAALLAAPLRYLDGRAGRWDQPPATVAHL